MCSGLFWCIVEDLCLVNSVEGLIVGHEITDTFSEVYDLNPDVPEEIIYGTSTDDNDHLWAHSRYEELHGNTDWSEWVPTYLYGNPMSSSPKDIFPELIVMIVV